MPPLSIPAKALRDYASPKILSLTFLPALLAFGLSVGAIILYGGRVGEWVFSLLPSWANGWGWLGSVLGGLVNLCVYLLLAIGAVVASMFVNVFFSIFYTPIIVEYVRTREFAHREKVNFGTLGECVLEFLKCLALYGTLFVLCIPLYFVPLLGSCVLFLLGYGFFRRSMLFDVASSMMSQAEFQNLLATGKMRTHGYTLLAYLPSFVPFLSCFLMPLQILLLTHYLFTRLGEKVEAGV